MPVEKIEKVDTQKLLLRSLMENVYDIQSTRIAMGNRLVANLRSLGVEVLPVPTSGEEGVDVEKETNKLLVRVLQEFKLTSEVYAEQFSSRGSIKKALTVLESQNVYIKTELAYGMVELFTQISQTEQKMTDVLAKEVKKHPLWSAFFADVRGCGPLMAAVCIAYLDPYKARWPSSFWRYAGLDVVHDEYGSHGRGRRDAYMITYTSRNGETAEKKTIGFNPILKTKLIGVLGSSFLRAGKEGKYAQIYYGYRARLENRLDSQPLRPVVIHRRATRYAVKMFLQDLWYVWRELEGLPTGDTYAVAKLGMSCHMDARAIPEEVTDDDVLRAALESGNKSAG